MKPKSIAVVGAAETTQMGKIPDVSVIGLHADAALNAMADAGLKPSDIDGVATAGVSPVELAHYMGIKPTYADGTSVGGCSFLLHVRHAAAASERRRPDRARFTNVIFPRRPPTPVAGWRRCRRDMPPPRRASRR